MRLSLVSPLSPFLLLLPVFLGCGKKGPPQLPFVRIPEQVQTIAARQVGSDVYVSLTTPSRNVDLSTPVAIARVDVYAYTGRAVPPRGRWAELGTLVASVPTVRSSDLDQAPRAVPVTPGAAAEPRAVGVPGATLIVHDRLPPNVLTAPSPSAKELLRDGVGRSAVPAAPLRRFYTAFGVDPRGRPGPPGETASFALLPLPDPPPRPRATYSETAITITWDPSGGLVGFLLDQRPAQQEPSIIDDPEYEEESGTSIEPAPASMSYNVYRHVEPSPWDPMPFGTSPTFPAPPAPLNASPVTGLSTSDKVWFGRSHCYVVRSVRSGESGTVEGEPSEPVCLTPFDVFPPAPPRSLSAVPSGNAINLIWEPNDEPDLGGYLVLRGDTSAVELRPITPVPIVETRFKDAVVTAGARYVYAVVAVDTQVPLPNTSAESARVEETAPQP